MRRTLLELPQQTWKTSLELTCFLKKENRGTSFYGSRYERQAWSELASGTRRTVVGTSLRIQTWKTLWRLPDRHRDDRSPLCYNCNSLYRTIQRNPYWRSLTSNLQNWSQISLPIIPNLPIKTMQAETFLLPTWKKKRTLYLLISTSILL